jgi:hypothetical protein
MMKKTKSMEVGRLQRVVWYFPVQKMGKPVGEPLLSSSTNQPNNYGYYLNMGNYKIKRKSAHQLSETDDYLVVGCPRPQRVPSPM